MQAESILPQHSSVYSIVTEQVIKLLESGAVPWRRPWQTAPPCNLISQKEYRGINTFLLAASGMPSKYWLTYAQAAKLGGHVKAGEHGSTVVFWNVGEEKVNPTTGKLSKPVLLRYYRVFNLSQTQGISDKLGLTILLMALIVGTIELARSVDEPRFVVPSGATAVSVTTNTSRPVHFYMQNRFSVGNQARIQGTYEVKDGELTGQVSNSEIEPFPQGAVAPSTQMTSISIHVCYLGAQNHLPVFTQAPQFPIDSNRKLISTTANMQQPFPIPDFGFKIDVANLSYVSPPYLCAFVDGQQNFHLTYY
jgi:antirestriction factor ArdC-like protein